MAVTVFLIAPNFACRETAKFSAGSQSCSSEACSAVRMHAVSRACFTFATGVTASWGSNPVSAKPIKMFVLALLLVRQLTSTMNRSNVLALLLLHVPILLVAAQWAAFAMLFVRSVCGGVCRVANVMQRLAARRAADSCATCLPERRATPRRRHLRLQQQRCCERSHQVWH